jgi:hypothetical protein
LASWKSCRRSSRGSGIRYPCNENEQILCPISEPLNLWSNNNNHQDMITPLISQNRPSIQSFVSSSIIATQSSRRVLIVSIYHYNNSMQLPVSLVDVWQDNHSAIFERSWRTNSISSSLLKSSKFLSIFYSSLFQARILNSLERLLNRYQKCDCTKYKTNSNTK